MAVFDGVTPAIVGAANAAAAGGHEIERSLRFNDDDSAYLNRTPSSAGDRRTWTWSGWIKRGNLGSYFCFFGNENYDALQFRGTADNEIDIFFDGTTGGRLVTNRSFRDTSAWYHIVVSCDTTQATASDRLKLYVNGVQETSFSTSTYPSLNYQTSFNATTPQFVGATKDSSIFRYFDGYLAEINFIDGQALAASNFGSYDSNSVWQPKEYSGSYGTNGFYLKFADNSSDAALGTDSSGNGNTWTVNNLTAVLNTGMPVSAAWTGYAGPQWSSTDTWDSLSDATTNFGNNGGTKGYSTTTETWTGTKTSWTGAFGAGIRGADGWALKFSSSVTITVNPVATNTIVACPSTSTAVSAGTSYTSFPATMTGQVFWFQCSGQPAVGVYNSVAVPTAASIDSLIDTPTNYTADSGNNGGNYATLSEVDNAGVTLSNGNLEVATSGWQSFKATIGVTSGKWYWESQNKQTAAAILGVATEQASVFPSGSIFGSTGHSGGDSNPAWCWAGANYYFNATSASTGLSNHSATDIVMYALDLDNGKLWFGRNGTWYDSSWGTTGNPATGANATVSGLNTTYTYLPAGSIVSAGAIYNFGQRPFDYTPPTGFLSLCTQNLADPTIAKGSTAMDAVTYTGSASGGTFDIPNFSPDFLWNKNRASSTNHILQDIVRGYGDNKSLYSNLTNTESGTDNIMSVSGNTVTYGTNSNFTGSMVSWAWDAGTTTVSNTDGTITSSVRVNQDAGFSVVSYTGTGSGATVGHGLNAQPYMVILKNRTGATDWAIQHVGTTLGTGLLKLNSTNAVDNSVAGPVWNSTAPTSSVFSVGTSADTNGAFTYIAYCFAPVEGYSAFGSYEGNGSSDGPFIYTGFRPKFVLLKNADVGSTGYDWHMNDTERDPFNASSSYLNANKTDAEATYAAVDFVSNGFKIKQPGASYNGSGNTHVYACFAEHPFKTARAR